MPLLYKKDIKARLAAVGPKRLLIEPLLEDTQIGEVTIDLRVGYDFLVSVLTRKPYIGIPRSDEEHRGIGSYFQTTRREIGDRFILYPGQLVLSTTLEYMGLPSDVYADILARSSYSRLGIHVSTMMQPGFRGCFPLELANHGNNPVELVVGSRVVQTRLHKVSAQTNYHAPSDPRKYMGAVRPVVSRASDDSDLSRFEKIRNTD